MVFAWPLTRSIKSAPNCQTFLFSDTRAVSQKELTNVNRILFGIVRFEGKQHPFGKYCAFQWLEIEEKIVSTLKFSFVPIAQRFSICWTRKLYSVLFLKNYIHGRRLTSGDGLTSKTQSDPCVCYCNNVVYYYILYI